MDIEVSWL